jgi:hypothetical protein
MKHEERPRNDTPSAGELYRTNKGSGRAAARVVRVTDDTVTLELVGKRNARTFTLPLRFFVHRACGWAPPARRFTISIAPAGDSGARC